MHDIEPHYAWRDTYISSEDRRSPHYGRVHDEFTFRNTIYNYYIHPQWDDFGSTTLYIKILYVDYEEHTAICELIGEWNDCLHNDIEGLKRNVINPLVDSGINKFLLMCDNVLNFHSSDNCYYEEWHEDIVDDNGWIILCNVQEHLLQEIHEAQIQHYVHVGQHINFPNWRSYKPQSLLKRIESNLKHKKLYLP